MYDRNKRLVSRKIPGAVIHEPARIIERIEQLISNGEVTTIDGDSVPLEFDSILLHGDSPGAVAIAQTAHTAVRKMGVEIKPMSDMA